MSSSPTQSATANYNLEFDSRAQKEYRKLEPELRLQLAKKLKARLAQPRVEKDRLNNMADCYRLVYKVIDQRVVVLVIAIGKRERCDVYSVASARLN